MICPAMLDPFQGASYRLIAAGHQALLCPIIAKLLGYLFTPAASITSDGNSMLQSSTPKDAAANASTKGVTHRNDSSSQVQNMSHSIYDDRDNGTSSIHTKTNQIPPNERNTKNENGKQIENGCDTGNGDASIPCPNDSNKKMQ